MTSIIKKGNKKKQLHKGSSENENQVKKHPRKDQDSEVKEYVLFIIYTPFVTQPWIQTGHQLISCFFCGHNRSFYDEAVRVLNQVYGSLDENSVPDGHLDYSEASAAKSSLLFGEVTAKG